MKYPDINTILHSRKREASEDLDDAKAAELKPADPAFIPANIPELNAIIRNMGVSVFVDVPLVDRGQMETAPYTNSQRLEIHMPHPDAFTSRDYYAHALAHELGHFTMKHFKRRGWKGYTMYDAWFTDLYNDEELVAELTAMRIELLTLGRFTTEESSFSYLRTFLEHSNEGKSPESRYAWAMQEAEKNADYLLTFAKG